MKSVTTKKGTELPLKDLKGKPYLQVAHRLLWFLEENMRYTINTNFLVLTDKRAVTKATINIFNDKGELVRTAEATKSETQEGFADFVEKSETGAVGRALAALGYGTQFAVELDEGDRIVDAPVDNKTGTADAAPPKAVAKADETPAADSAPTTKKKKNFVPVKAETAPASSGLAGWK